MAYALVTAISMLLFVSALKNTSVAHVAVITATVPFIAALLGWLILAQRPSVSAIIASACALAGVIVMVQFANDGQIYGDILAMLMAIGMSFMILISRKNPDMPALPATCLASLISAIAALPFATFASVTANDFTILIAFAIVNQVIGFGLFAIGARWLPPTETALLTALEAPLAPFWVWLVFYEVPASQTMLGGTIVLGAVIAHILWENQKIKTKR
jgi:drug/metabolite transporter (DMT)-like permease